MDTPDPGDPYVGSYISVSGYDASANKTPGSCWTASWNWSASGSDASLSMDWDPANDSNSGSTASLVGRFNEAGYIPTTVTASVTYTCGSSSRSFSKTVNIGDDTSHSSDVPSLTAASQGSYATNTEQSYESEAGIQQTAQANTAVHRGWIV
jgi:hypothetical protein